MPTSGEIFAVLFALKQLADQVGMSRILGSTAHARLALFLVLARIAHGGSRLSAVRWTEQQAVEEVPGIGQFDEEDLSGALDWLAEQQDTIERQLYQDYIKRAGQPPALVLYDVTSSYLEGEQNELGAFGYNRDGKRGKQQIVVGLLTTADGEPLAVRMFEGATFDPSTVAEQINLLKQQFGVTEVVLVGDLGMIKSKGKAALSAEGWRYITALTQAQIRTLKTDFLEVQPIFVRKAKRTRGHVFVAMLALKITRLFEDKLQERFGTTDQDASTLTVGEALTALSRITYLYYNIKGRVYARLPRLDELQQAIFEALGLNLPMATPLTCWRTCAPAGCPASGSFSPLTMGCQSPCAHSNSAPLICSKNRAKPSACCGPPGAGNARKARLCALFRPGDYRRNRYRQGPRRSHFAPLEKARPGPWLK